VNGWSLAPRGHAARSWRTVNRMTPRHLVVVPHTHWDREWYATHEQFRHRLVRLIDRLLDILEGDPAFRCFTLDGQTIVLEDYLEVRPGARERIEKLVHAGRLFVGPWYVLPDEWLVSGEALIRNLRIGLERAAAFGPPMRLGYAPDLFGHVGQLPQLFAGFGFDTALVWRGVGADVDQTVFDWESPDGTRLPTVYLRHGYGNAVHLPLEPEALRRRLERDIGLLEPWSRIPSLLLMNGSDHVEPQAGLPAALAEAVAALPGTTAEIGSLAGYAARARAEAPADRPLHRGELRSGLRAPLLPGCASSRMAQKRADFRNDRLLTAYLEPLAAWVGLLGGDAGCDVIAHAWRVALQNHPHDSICGCSVDAVHAEIDVRLARVDQIARAHLDAIGAALAAQVRPSTPGPGEALLVWNPHGAGPVGVDAELELDLPLARGRVRPFHLRDVDGRRLAASATVEAEGPVLADFELPTAGAAHLIEGLPPDFAGAVLRSVRWRRAGERRLEVDLRLAAAPGDVDAAAARGELQELLASGAFDRVRLRAARLPRVRLRFADELPGHGLRSYRVAKGRAGGEPGVRAARRPDGGAWLEGAVWRIEVDRDGRVALLHRPSGRRIEDALRIVSEGDRGDEYNFDPVPGGAWVDRPERLRIGVESGEAEASLRLAARYRVPRELAPTRDRRSARTVALDVALRLRLRAGLDALELEVDVDQTARDHRLRLLVAAPFAARRLRVESAFEVAERPIAPGPEDFGSRRPSEFPIGTGPQRRFASVDDGALALTVANRGGGEVEAVPDGERTQVALTLLRAVGWLSRGDLRLRPGDAGPPLATPGAQVPGPHHLEFALRLHPADEPVWIAEALRFATPALALPGREAAAPGASLADGARAVEIDDPRVLLSALEPLPDGGVRVRVWNASPEERRVRLAAGAALQPIDLRDEPDPRPGSRAEGGALVLALRPWQIATAHFGGRVPQSSK
jgi:Glycosyl hydrolases family 38 N-terminal domain/Glycosyl hydrolases family 38 C-terminal domain